MTAHALWKVLRKRWYVVLLGACCTAVLFAALSASPRVYSAQTDVHFVAPGDVTFRGLDQRFEQALIEFAGVVGEQVNEGQPTLKLSSPTATLFGTGVREGLSITLPDAGGQWQRSFNRPVLSVQVVDSSEKEVARTLTGIVDDIAGTALALQAETGTDPADFITVQTAPETTQVRYVGPTPLGLVKGQAALLVVAIGVTMAAAVLWDRAATRRRDRRESTHGAA